MTDSPDEHTQQSHSAIDVTLKRISECMSTPTRQFLGASLALALVVLAAYSNILASELHSDERVIVENSLASQGNRHLPTFGALEIGIEARLFGLGALGYRVVGLGLHLLAALGVYGIARRFSPSGLYGWLVAVLAAAIFAAHPAATHAVDSLRARPELLGSALAVSGIALMLSAVPRPEGGQWRRAASSIALLAAGCATSPAAFLSAPMLPVLEYALTRRVTWRLQIPAIFAVVLVAFVRGLTSAASDADTSRVATTPVLSALKVLTVPLDLLVYHAPPETTGTIAWLVVLAVGIIAYAVIPSLGAAVLWFALTIRLARYSASTESFDEATMHLAAVSAALLAAFVLCLPRGQRTRALATAAVGFTLLAAIAITSTRNNTWRSEAALWLQAHEACPDCAIPAERLSKLHYDQAMREIYASLPPQTTAMQPDAPGHLELAIEFARIAGAATPPDANRVLEHADALRLLGQIDEAQATLAEAVLRDPTNSRVIAARADAAFDVTDPTRNEAQHAVWDYQSAMGHGTVSDASLLRYAHALARIGDWRRAFAIVRGLNDTSDPAIVALASEASARLQSAQTAQTAFAQAAQRVTAADRAAIVATILVAQGHVLLADQVAQAAVGRYTGSAPAWMAAALAQRHMDRMDKFIAAGVPPNVGTEPVEAWTNLSVYFVRSGEPAAAEQVLRDALVHTEFDACMRVAAIARDAQRPNVAASYLRRAAELDAANSAPWLDLAELAIDTQQLEAAREAISNAEQRGADPITLNALKTRAGIAETDTLGVRRTIIR